CQEYINSPFTF
nr:immunoglobulin light chain junction region [Macaca mulatta]